MARCTCTGQPPGAASTAGGGRDLDTAVAAEVYSPGEYNGQPLPEVSTDPFDGWRPRPGTSHVASEIADQLGLHSRYQMRSYGEGVAGTNPGKDRSGQIISIVGIADLNPAKVDALRRCGFVRTMPISSAGSSDVMVTVGPAAEDLPDGMAEAWLEHQAAQGRNTTLAEVVVDQADSFTAGEVTLWAAGERHRDKLRGKVRRLAESDADAVVKRAHPNLYWTAVTGATRSEFDEANADRYVVEAQRRDGNTAVDRLANGPIEVRAERQNPPGRRIVLVDADRIRNCADHALVLTDNEAGELVRLLP